MIVCHCTQISDRVVRALAHEGAESVEDVMSACGAGACCGGCKPLLEELLVEETANASRAAAAAQAERAPDMQLGHAREAGRVRLVLLPSGAYPS